MQALWMVVAAALFACMGASIKFASQWFNSAEIVLWRGCISLVLVFAMTRVQGVSLRTAHGPKHLWRSVLGVSALGCWFYAIARLPLATASTLNTMSSLWIGVIVVGANLLAWRPGRALQLHLPLLVTLCTGFLGVLLMLRPSMQQDQTLPALLGLLSGLLSAQAYLQVQGLSRLGEPDQRVVFYFSAMTTVAGLGLLPFFGGFSDMSAAGWQTLWLLPVGIFATAGQLCMTRAYASTRNARGTLVVANLQYAGIVFSGLLGFALFGDRIPLLGWLGMALIVFSGMTATLLRARRQSA